MSADILEKPDTTVAPTDTGEHDRFKHYVSKTAWERAYVWGEVATALCGKKWVPQNNPDNYPVCPSCKEAYERIPG